MVTEVDLVAAEAAGVMVAVKKETVPEVVVNQIAGLLVAVVVKMSMIMMEVVEENVEM